MYELHQDEKMGLEWIESTNPLNPGKMLEGFPLSDDARSAAYIAWRETQT